MILDEIDTRILNLLQQDCTMSLRTLAGEIGLTQTPCFERVKKLKESGVIVRYSAILSSELLGFGHRAVLRGQTSDEADKKDLRLFESLVAKDKSVVSFLKISSKFNYVISYRYKEIDEFFNFVAKINKEPLVRDSEIVLVLETIKDDHRVQL